MDGKVSGTIVHHAVPTGIFSPEELLYLGALLNTSRRCQRHRRGWKLRYRTVLVDYGSILEGSCLQSNYVGKDIDKMPTFYDKITILPEKLYLLKGNESNEHDGNLLAI
jgi:hypothetical protein